MGNESVTIRGKVFTGSGDGKKFTSLPWFKKQVFKTLGFEPYPGTLNLMLTEKDGDYVKLFNVYKGYRLIPRKGYLPGSLYSAVIMPNIYVAVVRPCIPEYPKNVLEIIAPICLRKKLNLRDGDEVEVKILFK